MALCVDPRLGLPVSGPVRPWLGLLVILLLVAGLAFVGETGIWLAREAAPHREGRQ